MATRNRAAFTLVELLVVIAIIGVLVGLLMPAVLAARERARVAECMNRQGEIGKATINYELTKKSLPGYANRLVVNGVMNGVNGVPGRRLIIVSWAVMLLPYLDRNDLWEDWRGDNVTKTPPAAQTPTYLKTFVCPTDAPTTASPLSYVVNVGWLDTDVTSATFNTVNLPSETDVTKQGELFRNRTLAGARGVSMTDIKSASRRPMIAESAFNTDYTVTTRQWTDFDATATPGVKVTALQFGFLFRPGGPLPTPFTPVVAVKNSSGAVFGAILPIHNGLVNVTFCDGHTESLNNDPENTCDKYDWANIP